MIIYRVKRRFFDMKGDAEAYRKELGAPPAATVKLSVGNRTELAKLLNTVMQAAAIAQKREDGKATAPPNHPDVELEIPDFIKKSVADRH